MNYKQFVKTEVDIINATTAWGHSSPWIWSHRFYLTDAQKAASFWTQKFGATYTNLTEFPITIGTVVVDNTFYNEVNSLADLRDTDETFYFDIDLQTVYVHFLNQDPYRIFLVIQTGEALVFINEADLVNGRPLNLVFDGQKAVPRLLPNVDDTQTADDLDRSRFYYDDFSFSVDNSDGEYDTIRRQVINSGARLFLAEIPEDQALSLSDFVQIRTGRITDVSFPSETDVRFSASDPRRTFEQKINIETFNTTDYPSADTKLIGKSIPLLLGRAIVPGQQVNTTEFLFASPNYGALTAVHGVTVDGSSVSFSTNLSAGTVTISGYTDGDVAIDATGINTTNVVDQIVFLFDTFADIPLNASNFNLTEVTEIQNKTYTGALYIGTKGEKLNDAIQRLALGINTRVYLQPGGIYGMRDISVKTSVDTIKAIELAGFPGRTYDDTRYYSEITVNYNENYATEEALSIFDDSLESQALSNQRIEVSFDFDSTVDNSTDAQALLDARYEQAIAAPAIIEVQQTTPLRFNLLDYVNFEHTRFTDPLQINKTVIIPLSNYRVERLSWINRTATLVRIGNIDADADVIVLDSPTGGDKGIFVLDIDANSDIIVLEGP